LALNTSPVKAAEEKKEDKQRKLISILQSDAPAEEKAITCKQLAIYGSENAVPALAALLGDERLASWARIALEVIPGPAADAALREAMGKLRGRLLIGVLNSIGVRRDPMAVNGLCDKLKDNDAEVACAAASALGRIGGAQAASALEKTLATAPAAAREAVAEGCIRCAEQFLAKGEAQKAAKLYERVRTAQVPKQMMLDATRGAILARGKQGLPLLLEQLRSEDKALLGIGLRTARELPGEQVTEQLAAELRTTKLDRQPLLLLAIADRHDPAALPPVMKAARSGPPKLRIVALGLLEKIGTISSVPILLSAAADPNPEVAQTGMAVLTRLAGSNVDADLLARLQQSTGRSRQVVVELAGRRRIEAALPLVTRCAEDEDPGVRSAAVQAMGLMGDENQIRALVNLLQTRRSPRERAEMEAALLAICGRKGSSSVPLLAPLVHDGDGNLRVVALHAMAAAGGPEAMVAVQTAVGDKDESVQDEAVRTLATWPNTWPDDSGVAEPLLGVAKTGRKTSHQLLALRGYLQLLHGDKKISSADKIEKLKQAMPLIQRPDEKRLAIAVLDGAPTPGGLEVLMALAMDPAVTEDGCSALMNGAGKEVAGISKEERQKALQMVMQKSADDARKKKAEETLKTLQ
jgi:HEAT repeat protein